MHWGGLYVQKQFAIERKEFSARMQQVFVSTTEEHEKGRFAPSVQAELSSFVKKSVFQDSSRVLYMWRICSRQFAENVQFLPAMMQYLAQNAEKDLACGFTFEDVTQMAWIVSRFPPEIDDSARTSQCSACIPEVAVHVAIKMYTDYFRLMDAPPHAIPAAPHPGLCRHCVQSRVLQKPHPLFAGPPHRAPTIPCCPAAHHHHLFTALNITTTTTTFSFLLLTQTPAHCSSGLIIHHS